MSRFKAGDLAIVVGCNRCEYNIGKTVELVRFVKKGEVVELDGARSRSAIDAWVISGESVAYWSMKNEVMVIGREGLAAEEHLIPLRGDFTPEEMRELRWNSVFSISSPTAPVAPTTATSNVLLIACR